MKVPAQPLHLLIGYSLQQTLCSHLNNIADTPAFIHCFPSFAFTELLHCMSLLRSNTAKTHEKAKRIRERDQNDGLASCTHTNVSILTQMKVMHSAGNLTIPLAVPAYRAPLERNARKRKEAEEKAMKEAEQAQKDAYYDHMFFPTNRREDPK